jgi:hypothetical protein
MGNEFTLRSWIDRGQVTLNTVLLGLRGERGQGLVESAMVIGFLAILAVTVLSVLGDVTGGLLADAHQAFAGSGNDASVPSDAFLGPRIAD